MMGQMRLGKKKEKPTGELSAEMKEPLWVRSWVLMWGMHSV